MLRASSVGILVGLVTASAASADVIIKIKETQDPNSKNPTVSAGSMTFGADRFATRWDDRDEGHGFVIFRADRELMWVIDERKKSYQQLDKAFFDQAGAQMSEAKAQIQAQLEKLPPDQRAKAEEMMKSFGGAVQEVAQKIDYRKTAHTRTINGHPCTRYDTYWGDELVSYSWVAPYSALKLSPKDAEVFRRMGEFLSKMTSSMASFQKDGFVPMHELGGFPLLTQELHNGKVTSETLVESVTRGAAPAGSYEVPAGYKQEAAPSMGRKK